MFPYPEETSTTAHTHTQDAIIAISMLPHQWEGRVGLASKSPRVILPRVQHWPPLTSQVHLSRFAAWTASNRLLQVLSGLVGNLTGSLETDSIMALAFAFLCTRWLLSLWALELLQVLLVWLLVGSPQCFTAQSGAKEHPELQW